MRGIIVIVHFGVCSYSVVQEVSVGMPLDTVKAIFDRLPLKECSNSQPKARCLFATASVRFTMIGATMIEFDSNDIVKSVLFTMDNENKIPKDDDFENAMLLLEDKYGKPKTLTKKKDKESYSWKKGNVSVMIDKDFTDIVDRAIFYSERFAEPDIKKGKKINKACWF